MRRYYGRKGEKDRRGGNEDSRYGYVLLRVHNSGKLSRKREITPKTFCHLWYIIFGQRPRFSILALDLLSNGPYDRPPRPRTEINSSRAKALESRRTHLAGCNYSG